MLTPAERDRIYRTAVEQLKTDQPVQVQRIVASTVLDFMAQSGLLATPMSAAYEKINARQK